MSKTIGERPSFWGHVVANSSVFGGALCLAAQVGCSGPEQGESDRGGSSDLGSLDRKDIRETVEGADPVRDLVVDRNGTRAERLVRFNSLGREFVLQLVPNRELFADDLVVMRDGVSMTAEQAGLEPPLRGTVSGDSSSWVRARLKGDAIEGLVFTEHELYEIRPHQENYFDLRMAKVKIGDYVANPSGNEQHCGVVDDPSLVEAPPEPGETLEQQGCTWIGIHVIADYTFANKTGGASGAEREMATRMNEIDGIYRTDINHGFRVEQVTSHAAAGGPQYNAQTIDLNSQLTALRTWKQQNDAARGLVHLFSGRVTSGAVGLAYVGGVCNASSGAGISNYLGANRSSTICPAHELGHNFGANHDAQGAAFIMAPSVNRNATTFSPQSKSDISTVMNRVRCFTACGAAGSTGTGGTGGSTGTGGTAGTNGASGTGGSGGSVGGTGGSAGVGGTGGSVGGTGGSGGTAGSGGTSGTGAAGGTGGSAGVSGSGGANGNAGASGANGASGNAGAGAGGNAGVSGNAGVGGDGGAVGVGGNGGAGGSVAGTGAGASAGTAGTGPGNAATDPPFAINENESGCGCRTVAPSNRQPLGLLLGLGLIGVLQRRRARGGRRER
jgi:hypothetical protein